MIYTIEELAERWKCTADTIYRMIASGKLPAFKLSRTYRVREEDVLNYEKGG
jgi:excisionase family DNA binding protein